MDELNKKIENQNQKVQEIIEQEKINQENLSKQIDEEMSKFIQNIKLLNDLNPKKINNPLKFGLSKKMSELNKKYTSNQNEIKKNKDEIPDILRKKKESEEFFTKFMGEKKVWLDRLQEKKLQNIAYSNGFKYLYEAKAIKLLLEGILLIKVEDEIEKELALKGEALGWSIMNEEIFEKERKEKEFQFNLNLAKETDNDKAIRDEMEFREKAEKEEKDIKDRRAEYQKEWKELWGEIWVPNIAYNGDESMVNKRKFIQKIMMEVTFRIFRREMFDVWKFKNILNNKDQYVIIEKIKKYLNEIDNDDYIYNYSMNHVNTQRKDEDAFDKMTNIIENIRREEEIIYCDLTPAKIRLNEIKESSGNVKNESAERIENIINKIEELKRTVEEDPSALLKREVEEIYGIIKNMPDENEKKLFKDNLMDNDRLYDVFLPLTTLLMIITFLSIGKKRTKNYESKLEKINEENEKYELENEEIKGKLNTLNEINVEEGDDDNNLIDYNEAKESLEELTKEFASNNENIFKQQNKLFEDIQNNLVRP